MNSCTSQVVSQVVSALTKDMLSEKSWKLVQQTAEDKGFQKLRALLMKLIIEFIVKVFK